LFRHSVNYEGEYLLREYNKENKSVIKYPPVPHAIFTYPQIAGV
jgi:dihydrolipoamide dehydrogenase